MKTRLVVVLDTPETMVTADTGSGGYTTRNGSIRDRFHSCRGIRCLLDTQMTLPRHIIIAEWPS